MASVRSIDLVSFLAHRRQVGADLLAQLSQDALAQVTDGRGDRPVAPAEVIAAILRELRKADVLTLGQLVQVAEDYYDAETQMGDDPLPGWWSPLIPTSDAHDEAEPKAQSASSSYYEDIVRLIPKNQDPTVLSSYLAIWQNDKKIHFEQAISRISRDLQIASEDDIARDLGAIADELQFCQRCAEDCRLLLSSTLLEFAYSICQLAMQNAIHLSSSELQAFEFGLLRCIDVTWEIRTFIANGGDERQYWENAVSRENFVAVHAELAVIKDLLSAAGNAAS